MFKNLFYFPLGVQCTPIGFKRDPVTAALLGSAAIGAIGNIIGTSQSNTASASLNRETRDWQSKENAINRNWQEKMWNAQNTYNTPSAQKARLEAAGYNPYLDASTGVGTSSNAGSAGAPSNVSASSSPQMQPVPYGSIGSSLLQAVGLQADVSNQKSQAILNFAKSIPDLKKGGFSDDAIKELAMSSIGSSPSDMQIIDKLVHNEVRMSDLNVESQDIMNTWNEFLSRTDMRWSEQERDTKYKIAVETLKEISSRIDLNEVNADLSAQKILTEVAKALNLDADTQTLNALRPFVVKQAEYNADILLYERDSARSDYFYNSGIRALKESPYMQDIHTDTYFKFNEDVNPRVKKARVLSDILRGNAGYLPNVSYERSSGSSYDVKRGNSSGSYQGRYSKDR